MPTAKIAARVSVGTGKIACLMGTYGRVSMVEEGLSCFLSQTALQNATLLIYNQHPIPLSFDHPRVRVVNETPEPGPIRFIMKRMFDLAPDDAEFFQIWHDDDLYLPWHLETAVANIGDGVAWKPASSWTCMGDGTPDGDVTFALGQNYFEGSWLYRADYARRAPLDTHPKYLDHPVYFQTLEANLLRTTELGARASYIYRWANGIFHNSQTGGEKDTAAQGDLLATQRAKSLDVRADGRLQPPDMTRRWRQYLAGTRALMTEAEWEANRAAVRRSPSWGGVVAQPRRLPQAAQPPSLVAPPQIRSTAPAGRPRIGVGAIIGAASNPVASERQRERLAALCAGDVDWDALPQALAVHRVGPLLYWHLRNYAIDIPANVRRILAGIYLESQHRAVEQAGFLEEFGGYLDYLGIPFVVLKGGAFAHTIYPEPHLRPMGDLDILVDERHLEDVRQLMLNMGMVAPAPRHRRQARRHHWPLATAKQSGVPIQVEVHRLVLNAHLGGYATISTLRRPLATFTVGARTMATLSLAEAMLTQTYRFRDLSDRFRAIAVADLAGLAERAHAENVLGDVIAAAPRIAAALRAVGMIAPLSAGLSDTLGIGADAMSADPTHGAYRKWPKLNLPEEGEATSLATAIRSMVAPGAWWTQLTYGAAPGIATAYARAVTHPTTLVSQSVRRLYLNTWPTQPLGTGASSAE